MKTIWQIFFIIGKKDKMQRDMDQVCVMVVVVVATILLCMGYVEMTKMRNFQPTQTSTCGRKSEIENKQDHVSAKRSNTMHPNLTGQKTPDMLDMKEPWMYKGDADCSHKEMSQDNARLLQNYEWSLSEDSAENKKFTDHAKTHDKLHMKQAANVRPYGPRTTQGRHTLNTKNTGIPGLMGTVRLALDKCNGKSSDIVKFDKECLAFGGNDAYMQARADSNAACTM